MKLVVLGSKGMLGADLLAACARAHISAQGFDLPELNITDFKQVAAQLPLADWVINCAAYTKVDDAQVHKDEAYLINSEGAHIVSRVCNKKKIKLAHLSTDYVFDGTLTRAYTERDQTSPINVYGASKLGGEKAIRSEGSSYLIIRTQSLFGKNGRNFVKTMVSRFKEGDQPMRVVQDQITSPTYTRHLAEGILRLIHAKADGIVHVAAAHECSWFDFARAIAEKVKPAAEIIPVPYESLRLPAPRPAYSVLDTRRYRMITGHTMPTWEQGLEEYLKEENFVS